MLPEVWVGIGSNVGDRNEHLEFAVRELAKLGKIARLSSIYETEPWGRKDQACFLNAVCALSVEDLDPFLFLEIVKGIESKAGRESDSSKWGPRSLDIDLLFWGDEVVDTDQLIIPHPEICSRRFVLVPILEIAPDLVHPTTGKKISEILANCEDKCEVSKTGSFDSESLNKANNNLL